MASFVVTCTTDCLFAGNYTQVNDHLFTKGTYKIIRYTGLGIPDSYAGVASNGKDKLTLKRVGATNEFTGTEKYTTGKLRDGADSYAERPVQAVYIPAPGTDVPPAPPVAAPSPAGLGVERVPQPDLVTPKPDPAHVKVDNPEVPIEQKTSVPSGPPREADQTPASSSSSDPPPPASSSVQPSSSAPPPPSSSARGMPTSSIVAIALACIVGLIILLLLASFYFSGKKSAHYQRRIRHAQRRY